MNQVFEGLIYLLISQDINKSVQLGSKEVLKTATPLVNDALSVAEGLHT
jgi:hypothetical protein